MLIQVIENETLEPIRLGLEEVFIDKNESLEDNKTHVIFVNQTIVMVENFDFLHLMKEEVILPIVREEQDFISNYESLGRKVEKNPGISLPLGKENYKQRLVLIDLYNVRYNHNKIARIDPFSDFHRS